MPAPGQRLCHHTAQGVSIPNSREALISCLPSSQREGSWLIQGDLNDIKHLTKAFGTYGIYEINDKLYVTLFV